MILFPRGQVVVTPGIVELVDGDYSPIIKFLARHQSGDWGLIDPEDAETNRQAVRLGNRILSAYMHKDTKIWIITESDRSVTTVLLPSEY